MKQQFSIRGGALRNDRVTIPLIGGEFGYWRCMRENWPAILSSIEGLGLKVISTYIPWIYHEIAEGEYDFEGETSPQRDLRGFLELTKERGFYLILKPGPYIYASWPFGGVPERVSKYHRLDGEFLKNAEHYIKHVCEFLAPYQITEGGNIILFQADNEPYPSLEAHGEQLGCFEGAGLFTEWLENKYHGNLKLLNKKWRSKYKSFDEACLFFHEPAVNVNLPLAQRLLPYPPYYMRYADSWEFVGWFGARIVETVAGWMRGAGIKVPIFSNGWSAYFQDFHQLSKVSDLVGMDVYPLTFMESLHEGEDEWLRVIGDLKAAESQVDNANVWSAEFQAGFFPLDQTGYLPPSHYKFVSLTHMARGLKGWIWHVLVNQDNWFGSPINEWGVRKEHYPAYKEIVDAAKKIEPWNLRELCDISVLAYRKHTIISPGNFQHLLNALEKADISYIYYDPECEKQPRTKCLLYGGANWLETEIESKLSAWVKEGGILIAFTEYPACDEYGEKLRSLPFVAPDGARPTMLPVNVKYRNGSAIIAEGGHLGMKVNFCFYKKDNIKGEPIRLEFGDNVKNALVDVAARIGVSESREFCIGYSLPYGEGKIIHIGSHPSPALVKLILEQEDSGPYANAELPGISTSVHRNDKEHMTLFVINRNSSERTVDVCLDAQKLGMKDEEAYIIEYITGDHEVSRRTGRELRILPVRVKGMEVTAIKITGAGDAREMRVTGDELRL